MGASVFKKNLSFFIFLDIHRKLLKNFFFFFFFTLDIRRKLFKDPHSESETYIGSETEDEGEEEGNSEEKDNNGNPLAETVVTEGTARKADEEALLVCEEASPVDEEALLDESIASGGDEQS